MHGPPTSRTRHRHTLTIDRELLALVAESRPGTTTTALVEAGLRALVERDAAVRLAALEGSAPEYLPPRRSAWDQFDPR